MKITVEQLKRIIRQEIREARTIGKGRSKPVARARGSFADYVIKKGLKIGWLIDDPTEEDIHFEEIVEIFITDADVLVIAYSSGSTQEYDLRDPASVGLTNKEIGTMMKLAAKEGLIRPHRY